MSHLFQGTRFAPRLVNQTPKEKLVKKVNQVDRPEDESRATIPDDLVDQSRKKHEGEGAKYEVLPSNSAGPKRGYYSGGWAGIAGRNNLSSLPNTRLENFPKEKFGTPVPPPQDSFEVRRRTKLRPKVSNQEDCFTFDGLHSKTPRGMIPASALGKGLVMSHQKGYKHFKTVQPHSWDQDPASGKINRGDYTHVTIRDTDQVPKSEVAEDVNQYGEQFQYGYQNQPQNPNNLPGREAILMKSRTRVNTSNEVHKGYKAGGYAGTGGYNRVNQFRLT